MMIADKYSITHTLITYYRMIHVQLFGISRQLNSGNQLSLVRAPSLGLGSRRFESCIPDTSKLNPRQLKLGFIVIFDCQERLAIKRTQYNGITTAGQQLQMLVRFQQSRVCASRLKRSDIRPRHFLQLKNLKQQM